MNRKTQGVLLLVAGLVALRLVVTRTFDSYVKLSMYWPLLLAGGVLVALGFATSFRGATEEDLAASDAHDSDAGHLGDHEGPGADAGQEGQDEHADHHHSRGPTIGWLLVLPLVVLLLVAPAPLGADAARRQEARAPVYLGTEFPPLPATADGVAELRITETIDRALWDSADSLDDTPVRLEGLVVHSDEVPDGFLLTRFVLSCCAADAIPVQVGVVGGGRPAEDAWVEVEGTVVPAPAVAPDTVDLPRVDLEATSVREVPRPGDTYE
ncbi:MAG: TIGR03943 family protein [Acidimicrobiales bacterium]|nr:TIGR03943 family protein [Acidimicrobiales bacterium]